jgi:glycosyltransferase involved in cell wall biosynthesis
MTERLERRSSPELLKLPLVEGRFGEWWRMSRRLAGVGAAGVAEEANLWLMKTLRRECARSKVHAVHSYEDCALLAFEQARKLGKACIYDLPVAYAESALRRKENLSKVYSEWMGHAEHHLDSGVQERKKKELELADLVLVPSQFAAQQLLEANVARVEVVGFGVDLGFWGAVDEEVWGREGREGSQWGQSRVLRFLFVGNCSVWKGVPLLLKAWAEAGLSEAELVLVGGWRLSDRVRSELPSNVRTVSPVSSKELRRIYRGSDVLVLPSQFEGFGLVILEAMASGLPVIASDATAAPEVVDPSCGWVLSHSDRSAWVEALRNCAATRGRLSGMGAAARERAMQFGWDRYREALTDAVAGLG